VEYIQSEIGPTFAELVKRKPELLLSYDKDPKAALAEAEKELHLEDKRATA